MAIEPIYLSPPHLAASTQQYVNKALDSNWIAPMGPMVDRFEEDLAKTIGNNSTWLALNSGTAAIQLALRLLDIQKGDVILCQSFSFVASVAPAVQLGAEVAFIGSEAQTWNICPDHLEKAITSYMAKGIKPKAIIAVSLYGMPFDAQRIQNIAKQYDIALIEDAAESLGSSYKGQPSGTFGDYSILSFNGNKIITTSGGGALGVYSAADKKRALYLATHAKLDAAFYLHEELGYNYRMSNIIAAIGVSQLEVLQNHVAARRANNQFYRSFFSNYNGVSIHKEPSEHYFSNHWLSCVTIDSFLVGITNEQLMQMLASHQIEARRLWKPLHTQPVFKEYKYFGEALETTLFDDGLCLPSGSNLTDSQKARIATVLEKCLRC